MNAYFTSNTLNSKNAQNLELKHEFKGFQESKKIQDQKCASYIDTIDLIVKKIKNFLKGTNFLLYHEAYPSPVKSIWRSSTYIKDKSITLFKKHGKGTSLQAAEASGYAELIERIQTGFLFSKNPYKKRLVNRSTNNISKQLQNLNLKFRRTIEDRYPHLPKWNDNDKPKYIKFLNIFEEKETYIDNRFLSSSNGMASGNTYEECFVQALCELFERYCEHEILLHKIQCPDIPAANILSSNHELINEFKKDNIEIRIKDLNLNKGYPCVGLVFNYKPYNVKQFKVGSATNINTAIERCVTETLQQNVEHRVRIDNLIAYRRTIINLYSTFPYIQNYLSFNPHIALKFARKGLYISEELEFLNHNNGEFKLWDYSDEDCYKEVKNLLNLCKNNRFHINICDFGWLDFPTLRIFVPELYIGFGEYYRYKPKGIEEFKRKILENICEITDLKILKTPEFLTYLSFNPTLADFFGINTSTLENTSSWAFFGLLASSLNEEEIAKLYWKHILAQDVSNYSRYKDLINNRDGIPTFLNQILPNCLNSCKNCRYQTECAYYLQKEFEERLLPKISQLFMEESKPNIDL